jgi:hypothetical protein
MSYLLSGLDLVVNNTTSIVINTNQSTIQGDIAPSENVIAVNSNYNRFSIPNDYPAATIKSTSKTASLTNVTAKAIGTTLVPIASTYINNLGSNLNIDYDGEYYVKLLLGTASANTTIIDSSSNVYNIVSSNVTANASNPFGSGSTYNSLFFNGTTSFLTINDPISSFLGSEDFTIEFFINPTNFTGGPVLIDTGTNLGFQYWQVALTATGTVQFIYTYGITTVTLVTTTTLTAATWSHVALVRNNTVQTPGNNFNIYINGVSGVSALIANKWGDTGTIASSISIGKRLGNTRYFNGYLSNLRITQSAVYTAAFTKPVSTLGVAQSAGTNIDLIPAGRKSNTRYSTTSVKSAVYNPTQIPLYNSLKYSSPTGQREVYDPDLVGNSRINSYVVSNLSNKHIKSDTEIVNVYLSPEFVINGSDKPNILESYGKIATLTTSHYWANFISPNADPAITVTNAVFATGTTDFTVECWVWLDPLSNGNAGILNTVSSFISGFVINRDNFGFAPADGSGNADIVAWSVPTSVWTHVALTAKSGLITGWMNGVAIGSIQRTYVAPAGTVLGIGRRYSNLNGYQFIGRISNVRFVADVAVYTGNFVVPTSPLTTTQLAGTNISAITGTQTKLLTLQNNTIIDSSSSVNTLNNLGSPAIYMSRYFGEQSLAPSNFLIVSNYDNIGQRYVSTPSANETNIEYINYKTDPRSVNKRVKNLIVGTTGVLEELQSWS